MSSFDCKQQRFRKLAGRGAGRARKAAAKTLVGEDREGGGNFADSPEARKRVLGRRGEDRRLTAAAPWLLAEVNHAEEISGARNSARITVAQR